MKTVVIGAGAVGLYYGAMLARSGVETHFVLRSDFAAAVRDGVRVESAEGGFAVRPPCHASPASIGPCDLVIVALKTTANASLRGLVEPLLGDSTRVLTLQNGLGNTEALAAFAPPARVLGGLCFVSLNRTAPAVVRHIHGGRILLGEFQGPAGRRTHELAGGFQAARVPCDVTDHLARAQWVKLVWNIPFNGLGVAAAAGLEALRRGALIPGARRGAVAPTDQLLGAPEWREELAGLMGEVIAVANALGHGLDPAYAQEELRRTEGMGSYLASTLVDFRRGSPMELGSMFLEPLARARSAGVATPRLERLCAVLQALAASRA